MARGFKRAALVLALVAPTLSLGVVPAHAGQPVGRCPADYDMVSAGRWGDEGRAIDKNGDGRVCESALPGVGNEGAFNVIDNNAQ